MILINKTFFLYFKLIVEDLETSDHALQKRLRSRKPTGQVNSIQKIGAKNNIFGTNSYGYPP